MAKGKNDKSDKAASKAGGAKADQAKAAKDTKAGANGKAAATGKKDAKKAPRPAVAAERATARSGSTLPGPPPPATVPEAVVPAARTAPDGATGDVPATALVAPPVAPAAAPAAATTSRRSANGSATGTTDGSAAKARPTAPAAALGSAVAPAAASERRPGVVDELTTLAMVPVDVARRILPERRLPFYLGVGALAVVGVVEWPVVLAAGMVWEALRRRRS